MVAMSGPQLARLTTRGEYWLFTAVPHWKDAAYREAMRRLLRKATDPDRSRLGRPVTRWGDTIRAVCSAQDETFTAWQIIAQDKIARDVMELYVVQ